jgi:hypothetical protein
MIVQKGSFFEVVRSCSRLGIPVAAGGPSAAFRNQGRRFFIIFLVLRSRRISALHRAASINVEARREFGEELEARNDPRLSF